MKIIAIMAIVAVEAAVMGTMLGLNPLAPGV